MSEDGSGSAEKRTDEGTQEVLQSLSMESAEPGSPPPPRPLQPQVLVCEDTPLRTLQEMNNSSGSEEDAQKAVKRPLKMLLKPRRLYQYHGARNPQLTPSPHGSQPMTTQPMTTQPQPPPPLEDSPPPPPPSGGDLSKMEDTEKTDTPDKLDNSSGLTDESEEGLTAENAEELLQSPLKKPRRDSGYCLPKERSPASSTTRRRVLTYPDDLKADIKRVFRDVWSETITVGMMNAVLQRQPALLQKCQKLKMTIHNFRALVHKLQNK
ncbi:velvet complex subunit B-like [Sander lucioperca]|uniref:velvet complex subunit B-like n=1 Tax=Sander lucioperca TaxID=283035 RepID=UPI00125DCC75|nr:velvet complex subunit B-like [Sander lucioperca]